MDNALNFLAAYGLIVLTVVMFLDQMAVPIPPEPFLLGAGALAAAGRLNPVAGMLFTLVAALAGNLIWYSLGRTQGTRILRFLCKLSLETDSCVRQMENSFTRHGTRSLLIAKFVPGLNTVAPAMAGIVQVRPGTFLLYNTAGAVLWIGTWGLVGYLFHRQLEQAAAYVSTLGTISLMVVVALVALYLGGKYWRRRRVLLTLRQARISADELKRMLDAGEPLVIVDARHALALKAEPPGIPGAIRISVEEIERRHEEVPRDREVVVYCS